MRLFYCDNTDYANNYIRIVDDVASSFGLQLVKYAGRIPIESSNVHSDFLNDLYGADIVILHYDGVGPNWLTDEIRHLEAAGKLCLIATLEDADTFRERLQQDLQRAVGKEDSD